MAPLYYHCSPHLIRDVVVFQKVGHLGHSTGSWTKSGNDKLTPKTFPSYYLVNLFVPSCSLFCVFSLLFSLLGLFCRER